MNTQQDLYTVVQTKNFEKGIRRMERRGYHLGKLKQVIKLLSKGELPSRHRNHKLKGDLAEYEECHIEPDWLLTYWRRKDILVLVMLHTGTHAELFGE